MPPFGREPDGTPPNGPPEPSHPASDQPIHARVTHSISGKLGIAAAVALVILAFSSVWGPALTKPATPTPMPQTLRYTNSDPYFPVKNASGIKPGEIIQMEVAACNTATGPLGIKVSRTMIPEEGGEGYFLPDITGSWQPGCSTVVSQAHKVPEGARSGRYYLIGKTTPEDGSEPLTWRSQVFTVVPK